MIYPATVLAESSLQSYWRLDEATGTYGDSKGAITGTPTNVTMGVTGSTLGNAAASFNGDIGGTNGSNIDFGNNYGFTVTAAFSFECAINATVSDATNRRIIDKTDVTNRGWYATMPNNVISFSRGDATAEDLKSSSRALTVGVWYLLLCTYDGTSMRMYLNGSEEGTAITSSRSIVSNTNPLRVGARAFDLIRTWNGSLDEVSIYNTALSATAASVHFTAWNADQSPALALPLAPRIRFNG